MRQFNSNAGGFPFSDAVVNAVWEKAQQVAGVDARVRRKDGCGAWIDRANYGQTADRGTGWEIDHIQPVSKGGTDALTNLQPLQWQNNRGKSDIWPGQWYCSAWAQ